MSRVCLEFSDTYALMTTIGALERERNRQRDRFNVLVANDGTRGANTDYVQTGSARDLADRAIRALNRSISTLRAHINKEPDDAAVGNRVTVGAV